MRPDIKKDIVIAFLCFCLVIMSVGYAILAQRLVINGNTKISGKFDVRITSIVPTENKTETAVNKHCEVINNVSASFSAQFSEPNDYIEYLVTIKNFGNLDAKLSSAILTIPETEFFKFERYGNALDNPTLLVGEETTIKIKVLFKDRNTLPDRKNNIASSSLILNYIQKK